MSLEQLYFWDLFSFFTFTVSIASLFLFPTSYTIIQTSSSTIPCKSSFPLFITPSLLLSLWCSSLMSLSPFYVSEATANYVKHILQVVWKSSIPASSIDRYTSSSVSISSNISLLFGRLPFSFLILLFTKIIYLLLISHIEGTLIEDSGMFTIVSNEAIPNALQLHSYIFISVFLNNSFVCFSHLPFAFHHKSTHIYTIFI